MCLFILLQRRRSLQVGTVGRGEAVTFTAAVGTVRVQCWAARMFCSRGTVSAPRLSPSGVTAMSSSSRSSALRLTRYVLFFLSFFRNRGRENLQIHGLFLLQFSTVFFFFFAVLFWHRYLFFDKYICFGFSFFFFSVEKKITFHSPLSTRWRQDTGSLCPPEGHWQSGTQNKAQTWGNPGFYSSSTCRKQWRGWRRAAWWRGGQSHRTDHCCWLSPGQSC